MSAVKVTGIQNKIYTGDKVVPEFTVKYGQETLEADKDYKVFCDSVEVGTATAVIKGIGEKYVGEKTVTFKITGTVLKPANVQPRKCFESVLHWKCDRTRGKDFRRRAEP